MYTRFASLFRELAENFRFSLRLWRKFSILPRGSQARRFFPFFLPTGTFSRIPFLSGNARPSRGVIAGGEGELSARIINLKSQKLASYRAPSGYSLASGLHRTIFETDRSGEGGEPGNSFTSQNDLEPLQRRAEINFASANAL